MNRTKFLHLLIAIMIFSFGLSCSHKMNEISEKDKTNVVEKINPVEVSQPPFFGVKEIDVNIDDVYALMNPDFIYKVGWQILSVGREKYDHLIRSKYSSVLDEVKVLGREIFKPVDKNILTG